ncbi:MAG: putative glycerol-3-phosphate acyltransferase [Alphaproteobacteria bacterium MarineAlpha5_Bin9]|nr:MAG: putative glycerol-3-phosphate acyltransferase [Alphaproteobacteria bacterium MarineAlpha5_Bin9]|tara:strand:+ start:802 stop:1395 length:594 start_codon:yes stop_codon:yes gene_type:complete
MDLEIFIISFFSYIIGSIPFGLIITKLLGYGDIRNLGSGNIGATNVLRTGNKFIALLVLILDLLKGFIPVFYLINFSSINDLSLIIIGSFAVFGHIFPIWLKFRGGKGVATYIGFLIGIDYVIASIFILSWISIAFIKKYSSLASICSLAASPFLFMIFAYNLRISLLFLIISLVLICKHIENIRRLINKKETKIKL